MIIHPRPDQELAIKDAIRAGLISFLPFGKRLQAGAGSVIFTGRFTKIYNLRVLKGLPHCGQ